MILAQFEAEFLGRGLEHAHALRHDLLADAVAGNDGDVVDAVGGHGFLRHGVGTQGSAKRTVIKWCPDSPGDARKPTRRHLRLALPRGRKAR